MTTFNLLSTVSKRQKPMLWLVLLTPLLCAQCSDKVQITSRYTYFEPIYSSISEVRESFDILPSQPVKTPGKLYFLNQYIFINEPNEGIHIIDNADPSNPVNLGFINIPGNFDLAGKGNILYADSYIDLVTLDISDINNIKEINRLEDVFPYYNSYGYYADSSNNRIVTGWQEKERIETLEGEEAANTSWFRYREGIALMDGGVISLFSSSSGNVSSPNMGNASGVGGSMARFTVVNNFLYTIDGANMQLFDISTLDEPKSGTELYVNFNIETIFPYKDKLFIGAMDGMHIFDNTNPEAPTLLSTYQHINSCDPVVVQNDTAYVTLRSGTECDGFTNQLEVIDVSDATSPKLLQTFDMENPHGLGIDQSTLFICEGEFGLKVFDASNAAAIDQNLIKHFKDIHAYDVIPLNGTLLMIGEDGLYQYDYSDPENIELLSKISTEIPD